MVTVKNDEEIRTDGEVTDLGLGIVLCLPLWWDDGISLIRIYQITRIIADNTGRAGIYQCLNSRFLGSFNDTSCPLYIHLLEHCFVPPDEGRRRSVNHDIRLNFLEDGQDGGEVGDVAIIVRNVV